MTPKYLGRSIRFEKYLGRSIRFEKYLVSVDVPQRRGDPIIVSADEQPRSDASVESLSTLKPGSKAKVTILRDSEELVLDVQF